MQEYIDYYHRPSEVTPPSNLSKQTKKFYVILILFYSAFRFELFKY
jgi:hypothetical protein